MENKEIKNEKMSIGKLISLIYLLVSLFIGVYVGFMAVAAFITTSIGLIDGKFRHNLAYFLDLINCGEKIDLEYEDKT